MATLKGSKTHENLKYAFAGESQANRRYLYFAKQADVEGYPDVAGLFRDTADGETGHAHGHLDYLKKVGDPATDLPIGDTRISSVQYIKFKLSPAQMSAWSRGAKIVIDHPHYRAERPLSPAELAELSKDFL